MTTPTPVPKRRLIAALDVAQGEGGERTALFDDGTVMHVVRLGERVTTERRLLMREEMDVVERVVREALAAGDHGDMKSPVLADESRRVIRLEVGDEGGTIRAFLFDDLSSLPLAVGRARGAMDDLRERFLSKETQEDELWEPAGVRVGDVLKRRTDGRPFRVVRDDTFERNVELVEIGGDQYRLFYTREDLPKLFLAPEADDR